MAETWTVRSLLAWAREWLERRRVDSPRLDAELLLAHALGCDRTRLYVDFDKPLSAEELQRFKPLVQRRAEREPVAYILGRKEFYGRSFAVDKAVFIPRPETENLVQLALEALPADRPLRVLDLCTGSGIVGISIAAERPQAEVDLVELSPEAARIAGRNAEAIAPGRVRVFVGDLYSALPAPALYDAVTANPPYVPRGDGTVLAPEIADHEPRIALFGGEDGLEIARGVVAGAPMWLLPGGFFGMEMDSWQAAAAMELCRAAGLRDVRVVRDLAGLDRHVIGRKGG